MPKKDQPQVMDAADILASMGIDPESGEPFEVAADELSTDEFELNFDEVVPANEAGAELVEELKEKSVRSRTKSTLSLLPPVQPTEGPEVYDDSCGASRRPDKPRSILTLVMPGEDIWFTQSGTMLYYGTLEDVTGEPPNEVLVVIREDGERVKVGVPNFVAKGDRDLTQSSARFAA